ncbi:MAG TPA: 3-dehydroquinate dehydratase [Bacteroidetes bacterium]|nr:3-dehydroquinate dehydratase [Bacteroidota bacterium]HAE34711.1 3-dehydroquinate dehydratase [Bacteroidota bacterium]HQU40065.1 type II 3-dehydroquinate dehydratase [Chitinophagales bacterium]HQU75479.1 type II 3-dehydroquinate dehydratase [Chitinophagales bacterium]
MKICIVNGPNLNLLGTREPDVYGPTSFSHYLDDLRERYANQEISYFQSNHEGELIDHLHEVGFSAHGIILNAGALSHYSYSLADAISAIKSPVIGVHISNIYARETFRHTDVLSSRCAGVISGLGLQGYEMALQFLLQRSV